MNDPAAITRLRMPKWGLSMTQGTVVHWLATEGAELTPGDEVVEVESEKINNAVEAPAAGRLRRQVAAEGDVVPVGGLLGVIADISVSDSEIDGFVEEFRTTFAEEAEEAAAPEPQMVQVGDRRLQYLRLGAGTATPLLLLPGFGGDKTTFVFNQEPLSADRSVFALDLPGQGGSTKDVDGGDLEFFTATVASFMDALDVERVHLAGHSMGGLIAAAFALQHPQRVASLTLISSAGLGEEINGTYLESFISASRRREMQQVLGMLFADPGLVTRRLVEDVLRQKRLDGAEEGLRTVAGTLFPDGRQATVLDLAPLEMPILAIWGSEDQIVPPSHAAHLTAPAQVELLAAAGHMPQMEAAGAVNRLLSEFLEAAAR